VGTSDKCEPISIEGMLLGPFAMVMSFVSNVLVDVGDVVAGVEAVGANVGGFVVESASAVPLLLS